MDIRKIAELHYYEGMNFAEIGRKLSCSRQYIQQLFNRNTADTLRAKEEVLQEAIEEYARAKNEMPDNIRVRILRNILNLSQQEIADSIGITQSRVSSLENNSINSQYYSAIFDKYEIVWQ